MTNNPNPNEIDEECVDEERLLTPDPPEPRNADGIYLAAIDSENLYEEIFQHQQQDEHISQLVSHWKNIIEQMNPQSKDKHFLEGHQVDASGFWKLH